MTRFLAISDTLFRCGTHVLVGGFLLFSPYASNAQIFAPAPNQALQPINPVEDYGPSQPMSFGQGNAELKNMLDLQLQMQLLKRLIEHEKAVSSIVESALAIGVTNPAISAPDKEACAQVPANLPCAQAYPDLYTDFSALDNTPAIANAVPDAPPILADVDVPNLAAQALPDEPAPQLATSFETLFWTDITCMAAECSAVISPDPFNPKARYRVINGERLPDGSTITSISASGVTLKRGGKSVTLEPAPNA